MWGRGILVVRYSKTSELPDLLCRPVVLHDAAAFQNTSWALCRTADGALGYVPTVAVPYAFRKMVKHTRMYARKTAYVDRFCKWKQTVFYPGDAVVILADRGKW